MTQLGIAWECGHFRLDSVAFSLRGLIRPDPADDVEPAACLRLDPSVVGASAGGSWPPPTDPRRPSSPSPPSPSPTIAQARPASNPCRPPYFSCPEQDLPTLSLWVFSASSRAHSGRSSQPRGFGSLASRSLEPADLGRLPPSSSAAILVPTAALPATYRASSIRAMRRTRRLRFATPASSSAGSSTGASSARGRPSRARPPACSRGCRSTARSSCSPSSGWSLHRPRCA